MSFWYKKRVLVTGGAGFIGSHLVEDLVKEGAIVSVADNLIKGDINNLRSVSKEIIMYITDLRNYDNCFRVSKNQDIVINLAGEEPNCEYVLLNKRKIFEDNMLIQINMLKAASNSNVERFLQASSCKVYNCFQDVRKHNTERGEMGLIEHMDALGLAKKAGEELAKYYAKETRMMIGIARLFVIYGRRDNFDLGSCHIIPALIRMVAERYNPVVVWGSGERRRVYVHVLDAVRCLKGIVEMSVNAEPIDIGHNEPIKIKDLVRMIQDVIGIHNTIIYDEDRGGKCIERVADVEKLKKAIGGFSPSSNLEKGIREVISYYLEHKSSIKREDINLASYYESE
jgi:nucleoside-diphosphate-sugar epimerase